MLARCHLRADLACYYGACINVWFSAPPRTWRGSISQTNPKLPAGRSLVLRGEMRRHVWTVYVTLTLYVAMFWAVSVKRNGVQFKGHVALWCLSSSFPILVSTESTGCVWRCAVRTHRHGHISTRWSLGMCMLRTQKYLNNQLFVWISAYWILIEPGVTGLSESWDSAVMD